MSNARIDPDAGAVFAETSGANSIISAANPNDIRAFATEQTTAANNYLIQLANVAAGLAAPTINPVFPPGAAAPAVSIVGPPVMEEVIWTSPAAPSDFTETLDVSDIIPPSFTASAPDLSFPDAPGEFTGDIPDAPTVDMAFAMPELNLTLPARPDLLTINISKFGGMNMPTFDAALPTIDLVEPSIREYVPGDQYTSALLEALKASLLERITTGTTGLSPDAESGLWDREREREARAYQNSVDQLDKMEELGFAFPPGVYLNARLKLMTEREANDRGSSREIMIKAAELELENVKHALTTATTLEATLMENANAVEQRLFEASKYATEAGVAIYNARVQAFGAMIDAYRAQVNVYEARIRAEIAKVEAYKAEVDAESAKAQVNRALVDQYQAEINAAMSNVEIFKARIQGIQVQAEIERTKVMIYGEQVRGYAAKVNAYTAGIEAFRARIGAETSKQEAFTAQVRAYSARVDANRSLIDARIAAFRGQLDAFVARWDGYKSAYQGEAARASAIGSLNSSRAEAYRAQVQGLSSYNDVLTKQWQVALDQAQRVAEIGINAAKANAELYITTRSLALDAAKVGAQVSAQLGAAALNTMNWSTSYSNARSLSDTSSTSAGLSGSISYNYSASV